MQATRQDILEYLRWHNQASVKQLGEHLGLTATGIRQHLTILERDGHVEAREERGHVGRPALVYSLSSSGDALFPKKYDALANALIDEARHLLGPDALQRLMKSVAARFAEPYMARMDGKTTAERVLEVGLVLQERGCLSDSSGEAEDFLIRQHTCPFPNVASRNSAVCALDVEFVRRLVGSDARLTTSLLRGDDCCTFRVKPREPAAAARRQVSTATNRQE
ncbi:MAG: winged helix-turn-helix transcriptional regulator [Chloroflexota bacterium]|nr:winged helix-turn-helix transcriptional regulator [Chloroflexota bacterium]